MKTAKRKAVAPVRKKPISPEDASRYKDVLDQIVQFVDLIKENDEELRDAEATMADAKSKYDAAKVIVANIRELRDGAKHGLFRYLSPVDGSDILPLFDRMEPADEEVHGAHSDEWRLEPVAALRLSLPSQVALADAEVMLVGQLQDRVLQNPEKWWESITGLTFGIAAAIVDQLNDFIYERSTK